MPSLVGYSEIEILKFVLVFLRATALIMTWPILGAQNIPAQVKTLMAVVFSLCLFPAVKVTQLPADILSEQIIPLAVKEVLIGLALGFSAKLFFFSVSVSGQLISMSSGFSSAQIFNPSLGQSSQVLEEFQWILASLLFLFINGHHNLIESMAVSFQYLPISAEPIKFTGLGEFTLVGQNILFTGVKMAAPVVVSVILANVGLGVLGRAVPQINIWVTSMQITAVLSLFIIFLMIPLLVPEMEGLSRSLAEKVFSLMKAL